MTTVTLTSKEAEGLMWGLAMIGDYPDRTVSDSRDPLFVLSQIYERADLATACAEIEADFRGPKNLKVHGPLSDIKRDILRLCIENTTWLDAYMLEPANPAGQRVAEAALRTLSVKLDALGVEVNHMPSV